MFTLTKKQSFNKLLLKRTKENKSLLDSIDSLIKQKRGFILHPPKSGDSVVLLVSGGMDSIVVWETLMSQNITVYPLHVKSGQPRNKYEVKASKYYENLFQNKQYPGFKKIFFISHNSTPTEIRKYYRGNLKKWVHPNILEKNYNQSFKITEIPRNYVFPAFYPYWAIEYCFYLEMKENIKIRTIITAGLSSDAEHNSSQTLTANRSTMLSTCIYTNDWDWQIFSFCYERELQHNLDKKDLILSAKTKMLNLDKTHSCFKAKRYNCGKCLACKVRKDGYKKAHLKDPTVYGDSFKSNTIKNKIIQKINSIYQYNKNISIKD